MKFPERIRFDSAKTRNRFELFALLTEQQRAAEDPTNFTDQPSMQESYMSAAMLGVQLDLYLQALQSVM